MGSFLCVVASFCVGVDFARWWILVWGCKRKAPAFCRAFVLLLGLWGLSRLLVSRLLVFASCCLTCALSVSALALYAL